MKKIVCSIVLVLLLKVSFANVAQPGMWNSGYASRFSALFDEDSVHFGKIEMQKELVLINLYPGFAAIKGEYWMHNKTNEAVTMTVGYPVNGSYEHEQIGNVMYEDLFNLKVLVNGQQVETKSNSDSLTPQFNFEKWYYWKTTFAPNSVTKITVYFLTDNSKAQLRRGYNSDDGNAFTYVLESGRAWAGSIGSGQILIKLNDGLSLKNINGVSPNKSLKGDDHHLQLSFNNIEPMPDNNILIWYEGKSKRFNFEPIIRSADKYFSDLDKFPVDAFNKSSFKTIEKNDFRPTDTASFIFWGILIVIGLVALAVLGAVVYLIYKAVKNFRGRAKK